MFCDLQPHIRFGREWVFYSDAPSLLHRSQRIHFYFDLSVETAIEIGRELKRMIVDLESKKFMEKTRQVFKYCKKIRESR